MNIVKYIKNNNSYITTNGNFDSSLSDGVLDAIYRNGSISNGELTSKIVSGLEEIKDSVRLFMQSSVTSVKYNFDELVCGYEMFRYCGQLKDVYINCPKLTDGRLMFDNCTLLSNFSGDLSSLLTGELMFTGCILSPSSIENIANTIKDNTASGLTHLLDIGTCLNSSDNSSDDYNRIIAAKNILEAKNWTVTLIHNGTAAAVSLDENVIFIYVKPIEDELGNYIDSSNKKYTLKYAHYVTNVVDDSSWYLCSSLEEAANYFNLTKIESSEE